ncbi:MAG TPA: hypothetical protein VF221_20180 [Chloroflexota bacterium]
MNEDEDPVFVKPQAYGIENLEAPGEPDRDELPPVTPVPHTGRKTKEEHRRRHNKEEGHVH